MVRARSANGRQQTAKTSCTRDISGTKRALKTTKELDRHRTTRFEKRRHDLRSGAIARCQQRRLASTCAPYVSLTRDEQLLKV